MKKVLGLCFAVGLFTFGIQARAEAVPALTLRICQGVICINVGPFALFATTSLLVVGDYVVSTSGASQESPVLSNVQNTSIIVQRIALNNVGALEIWLSATGYNLPIAPELVFVTSFGATSSAGADEVDVTYQGWYSPSNSSLIPGPLPAPPADGITAGPIGCVIGGVNVRRPRSTACSATPPGLADIPFSDIPFSLVTRTTFNILSASPATYGSTAQANVGTVP
jgi:hypothetical protein